MGRGVLRPGPSSYAHDGDDAPLSRSARRAIAPSRAAAPSTTRNDRPRSFRRPRKSSYPSGRPQALGSARSFRLPTMHFSRAMPRHFRAQRPLPDLRPLHGPHSGTVPHGNANCATSRSGRTPSARVRVARLSSDLLANWAKPHQADPTTGTLTFKRLDGATFTNGREGCRAKSCSLVTPYPPHDVLGELSAMTEIDEAKLLAGEINESDWGRIASAFVILKDRLTRPAGIGWSSCWDRSTKRIASERTSGSGGGMIITSIGDSKMQIKTKRPISASIPPAAQKRTKEDKRQSPSLSTPAKRLPRSPGGQSSSSCHMRAGCMTTSRLAPERDRTAALALSVHCLGVHEKNPAINGKSIRGPFRLQLKDYRVRHGRRSNGLHIEMCIAPWIDRMRLWVPRPPAFIPKTGYLSRSVHNRDGRPNIVFEITDAELQRDYYQELDALMGF